LSFFAEPSYALAEPGSDYAIASSPEADYAIATDMSKQKASSKASAGGNIRHTLFIPLMLWQSPAMLLLSLALTTPSLRTQPRPNTPWPLICPSKKLHPKQQLVGYTARFVHPSDALAEPSYALAEPGSDYAIASNPTEAEYAVASNNENYGFQNGEADYSLATDPNLPAAANVEPGSHFVIFDVLCYYML
jgi:hypothetical protein